MIKSLKWVILCFIFLAGQNSLVQSAELENTPGLKVGDRAPDFTATLHDGSPIKLSDAYATGPVVLIFYRGAWCPYCNLHLQQFQRSIEKFEDYNALVLAISVDRQDYAQKAVLENQLAFDVVSDPGLDILRDFQLLYTVPEELREQYLSQYAINLEEHSGRTDGVIAIPATYLIDQEGKIIFAYASNDYKTRTSPDEVLKVLKRHYRSDESLVVDA
jgi:peroxiredoxin